MVAWPLGGIPIMFAMISFPQFGALWMIPFFGLMLAVGFYSSHLKCPRCLKPIGTTKSGIHKPFADTICGKCGLDLRGV